MSFSAGAPTPATYAAYAGTGMTNIGALSFNDGFGLPYAIFTPTSWAPLNSSGVGTPSQSYLSSSATNYGSGITPGLLGAAQDNLAGISYTGLNTITESGQNSQLLVGSLFNSWGSQLNQLATTNASILKEAVDKSGNANIGLIGGLLGGLGGVVKGIASAAALFI